MLRGAKLDAWILSDRHLSRVCILPVLGTFAAFLLGCRSLRLGFFLCPCRLFCLMRQRLARLVAEHLCQAFWMSFRASFLWVWLFAQRARRTRGHKVVLLIFKTLLRGRYLLFRLFGFLSSVTLETFSSCSIFTSCKLFPIFSIPSHGIFATKS